MFINYKIKNLENKINKLEEIINYNNDKKYKASILFTGTSIKAKLIAMDVDFHDMNHKAYIEIIKEKDKKLNITVRTSLYLINTQYEYLMDLFEDIKTIFNVKDFNIYINEISYGSDKSYINKDYNKYSQVQNIIKKYMLIPKYYSLCSITAFHEKMIQNLNVIKLKGSEIDVTFDHIYVIGNTIIVTNFILDNFYYNEIKHCIDNVYTAEESDHYTEESKLLYIENKKNKQ